MRHLVAHPKRLITKDDLFSAVWRDTIVSDAALASCIRDLRRALGDHSRVPRYIETVHRRGFRFIGPVAPSASAVVVSSSPAARRPPSFDATSAFVGRQAEIARLHHCFEDGLNHQRRVVFVTGEPGIGKTALVNAFIAEIPANVDARIGRGQCIEHYGPGEAYLPILEALGRMGKEATDGRLVQILTQYAPTWLAQLPALLTDADLELVQRRSQGATRDRMLRELVEALEALSADAPVVLVLEDLHWSDASTIDLLSMVARRREAARLLIIATYRPADIVATSHPLGPAKHELLLHANCEELPLEFLDVAAVEEHLSRRFRSHRFPPELSRVLHRHTGGNPLFLVNTIDDLMVRSQIVEVEGCWTLSGPVEAIALETPRTLLQMVEQQIERLAADEQAVLTVASIAGVEFSAAVAAADGIDVASAERLCEALARRGQFLRAAGVARWPDGTTASQYMFAHALYQRTLYANTSMGRQVGLHVRIAERLERAFGARAGEIAGELAVHFDLGRDVERAALHHGRACENSLGQHGYREAVEHATRALELLKSTPDTQQRAQHELTLHVMLGSALTAIKGHAPREVEQTYARARELCERVNETPHLFPALLGLGWFYAIRGPADATRDIGTRLSTMAQAAQEPAIRLGAQTLLGMASFYSGEFEAAFDHFEHGRAVYDPASHSPTRSPAFRNALDHGIACAVHAAWALWVLGFPDQAASRLREALATVRSTDHAFSRAHASRFAAAFHQCRREHDLVRDYADRGIAIAVEHGFGAVVKAAGFHRGWLMTEQGCGEEGLAAMHEWTAICRDSRSEALMPSYMAWLAETLGEIGQRHEGLALADEGLSVGRRSGYNYWAAELYRVKGILSETDAAIESFLMEALTVARRQRTKMFELRAATALGRHWMHRGRPQDARVLVSDVYDWFTEGFDTRDLCSAKLLLAELQGG